MGNDLTVPNVSVTEDGVPVSQERISPNVAQFIFSAAQTAQLVKIRKLVESQIPSHKQGLLTFPSYNVRKFALDTAQTDLELAMPGDYVAFYTDGNYTGTDYKLDSPASDSIPVGEFNPYHGKFTKIYLTWIAQAGHYLRVFVGRQGV